MNIGIIIQARMGSTRLPGKVMKKIQGRSVLEHVIERVKQSRLIDEIIIATTTHDQDSVIESEALRCGVKSFRGSEDIEENRDEELIQSKAVEVKEIQSKFENLVWSEDKFPKK